MQILPQRPNPWLEMINQRTGNLMDMIKLVMAKQAQDREIQLQQLQIQKLFADMQETQRTRMEGQQPSPLGFIGKKKVIAPEQYSQMAMSEYGQIPTKEEKTHIPMNWEDIKRLGPSLTEFVKEGIIGTEGGQPVKKIQPFTLGPGQIRYGEEGKPIAKGGAKEPHWQLRTEDKGDMYRQGYFNPETKETQWEEWKPKAATPSSQVPTNIYIGTDAQGNPLILPSKGTPTVTPTLAPPGGILPKTLSEDFKKDITAVGQANDLVQSLKKLYDPLKIGGRLDASRIYLESLTARNPAAKTYIGAREAFLGNLSRSLAAERGVLTQQDIERIAMALPRIGLDPTKSDNQEEAKMKWDFIDSIIKNAEARMKQRATINYQNIPNVTQPSGIPGVSNIRRE